MHLFDTRNSVFLRGVFMTAFLVLWGWMVSFAGFRLDRLFLDVPTSLQGAVWLSLPADSILLALKFLFVLVVSYVAGGWFFVQLGKSRWASLFFVVILAGLDWNFCLMFVAGLGAAVLLHLWMEGLPPFEIRVDSSNTAMVEMNDEYGKLCVPDDNDLECETSVKRTHRIFNPTTGALLIRGGIVDVEGNHVFLPRK